MKTVKKFRKKIMQISFFLGFLIFGLATHSYAHCDSYDGPVIQDAYKALELENVAYVLKWISADQEAEIKSLFAKTVGLKDGDSEIYEIVETHFLETLVRLHRETEGAPFTGLKPAGSVTPIIRMADRSIENLEVQPLLSDLGQHIQTVVSAKYEKVVELSKLKDRSTAEGRAYVEAYVDYTHTLEAIEHALAHGGHH